MLGVDLSQIIWSQSDVDFVFLTPSFPFQRQSNASQTLCDIIRLSRDQANQMQENAEVDPLLAVLES